MYMFSNRCQQPAMRVLIAFIALLVTAQLTHAQTVSSRSPSNGPRSGGTTLQISGTGFTVGNDGVVRVRFVESTFTPGGTEVFCDSVTVTSTTEITCETVSFGPFNKQSGEVDVQVSFDSGSNYLPSSITFFYHLNNIIQSSISPNLSPAYVKTDESVLMSVLGLINAPELEVRFVATTLFFTDGTQRTVDTDAEEIILDVSAFLETSSRLIVDIFTLTGSPLSGFGLVDSVSGKTVQAVDSIALSSSNGQQFAPANEALSFLWYGDNIDITAVDPSGAPIIGGTEIVIIGTDLQSTAELSVTLKASPAKTFDLTTSCSFTNTTAITCTLPDLSSEFSVSDDIEISVSINGLDALPSTVPIALYDSVFSSTDVNPSLGPVSGGTVITVSSTSASTFDNSTSEGVTIRMRSVVTPTDFLDVEVSGPGDVVLAKKIVFTAPSFSGTPLASHVGEDISFQVSMNGQQFSELTGASFELYSEAAISLTSAFSPTVGPSFGGVTVTISGSGIPVPDLIGETTVVLRNGDDSVLATAIVQQWQSAQIVFEVPSVSGSALPGGEAFPYDARIDLLANGQQSIVPDSQASAGVFTYTLYNGSATIRSAAPSAANFNGGTTVQLAGIALYNATETWQISARHSGGATIDVTSASSFVSSEAIAINLSQGLLTTTGDWQFEVSLNGGVSILPSSVSVEVFDASCTVPSPASVPVQGATTVDVAALGAPVGSLASASTTLRLGDNSVLSSDIPVDSLDADSFQFTFPSLGNGGEVPVSSPIAVGIEVSFDEGQTFTVCTNDLAVYNDSLLSVTAVSPHSGPLSGGTEFTFDVSSIPQLSTVNSSISVKLTNATDAQGTALPPLTEIVLGDCGVYFAAGTLSCSVTTDVSATFSDGDRLRAVAIGLNGVDFVTINVLPDDFIQLYDAAAVSVTEVRPHFAVFDAAINFHLSGTGFVGQTIGSMTIERVNDSVVFDEIPTQRDNETALTSTFSVNRLQSIGGAGTQFIVSAFSPNAQQPIALSGTTASRTVTLYSLRSGVTVSPLSGPTFGGTDIAVDVPSTVTNAVVELADAGIDPPEALCRFSVDGVAAPYEVLAVWNVGRFTVLTCRTPNISADVSQVANGSISLSLNGGIHYEAIPDVTFAFYPEPEIESMSPGLLGAFGTDIDIVLVGRNFQSVSVGDSVSLHMATAANPTSTAVPCEEISVVSDTELHCSIVSGADLLSFAVGSAVHPFLSLNGQQTVGNAASLPSSISYDEFAFASVAPVSAPTGAVTTLTVTRDSVGSGGASNPFRNVSSAVLVLRDAVAGTVVATCSLDYVDDDTYRCDVDGLVSPATLSMELSLNGQQFQVVREIEAYDMGNIWASVGSISPIAARIDATDTIVLDLGDDASQVAIDATSSEWLFRVHLLDDTGSPSAAESPVLSPGFVLLDSNTAIEVTMPSVASAGQYQLEWALNGQFFAPNPGFELTYYNATSLVNAFTSASPSNGPDAGGTVVSFLLSNPLPVNTSDLSIGFSVSPVNGGQPTLSAPAVWITSDTVRMTTPDITSVSTAQQFRLSVSLTGTVYFDLPTASFRYYETPITISTISPGSGPWIPGGTNITLVGDSTLPLVTSVRWIDSVSATEILQVDGVEIEDGTGPGFSVRVRTPLNSVPLASTTEDVVTSTLAVTTNGQQWEPIPDAVFRFYAVQNALQVVSITPLSGPSSGGTLLTVHIPGLVDLGEDGLSVTLSSSSSSDELECTTPSVAANDRVICTTSNALAFVRTGVHLLWDQLAVSLNGQQVEVSSLTNPFFMYNRTSIQLQTINPESGPAFGGTLVKLTGLNLRPFEGVDGVNATVYGSEYRVRFTSSNTSASPVDVALEIDETLADTEGSVIVRTPQNPSADDSDFATVTVAPNGQQFSGDEDVDFHYYAAHGFSTVTPSSVPIATAGVQIVIGATGLELPEEGNDALRVEFRRGIGSNVVVGQFTSSECSVSSSEEHITCVSLSSTWTEVATVRVFIALNGVDFVEAAASLQLYNQSDLLFSVVQPRAASIFGGTSVQLKTSPGTVSIPSTAEGPSVRFAGTQIVIAAVVMQNGVPFLSFQLPNVSESIGASLVALEVSLNAQDFFSAGQSLHLFGDVTLDATVPSSGPLRQATNVSVSGNGFVNASSVACLGFRRSGSGSASVPLFNSPVEFVSSALIRCGIPSLSSQITAASSINSLFIDIVVTIDGQNVLPTKLPFLLYEINREAQFLSLSPKSGPSSGATSLTLTGVDFVPTNEVQVRLIRSDSAVTVQCASPTVGSGNTSIVCATGAFPTPVSSATYTVEVAFNGQHFVAPSVALSFLVYPQTMRIRSEPATPALGPITGGTKLTVRGDLLVDTGNEGRVRLVNAGTLETIATLPSKFINSSAISVTVPSISSETDVVVEGLFLPNGIQASAGVFAFTYISPALELSELSPSAAPISGTAVRITLVGESFRRYAGLSVLVEQGSTVVDMADELELLGSDLAVLTSSVSWSDLGFSAGSATIRMSMNGQQYTGSFKLTLYDSTFMSTSAIFPESGGIRGGAVVTLSGENFVDTGKNMKVRFYVAESDAFVDVNGTFVSGSEIRALTPNTNASGLIPISTEDNTTLIIPFTSAVGILPDGIHPISGSASYQFFRDDAKLQTVFPATGPLDGSGTDPVLSIVGEKFVPLDSSRLYMLPKSVVDDASPTPTTVGELNALLVSVLSTPLEFISSTTLRATLPAGTVIGPNVPLSVFVSLNGHDLVPLADGVDPIVFEYFSSDMRMTSVSPKSSDSSGGQIVTLTMVDGFNTSTEVRVVMYNGDDEDNSAIVETLNDCKWTSSLAAIQCTLPSLTAQLDAESVEVSSFRFDVFPNGVQKVPSDPFTELVVYTPSVVAGVAFSSLSPSSVLSTGVTTVSVQGNGFSETLLRTGIGGGDVSILTIDAYILREPSREKVFLGTVTARELVSSSEFRIRLPSAANDLFGNALSAFATLEFTTQSSLLPLATVDFQYLLIDFSVSNVAPTSSPLSGSVSQTIFGSRFPPANSLMVRYRATSLLDLTVDVPAQQIGDSKLLTLSPDIRSDLQNVGLQLQPGQVLNMDLFAAFNGVDFVLLDNVDVRYYDEGAISTTLVSPPLGPEIGGTTFSLDGTGYVDTGEIRVRFLLPNGEEIGTAIAAFIAHTRLRVQSPALSVSSFPQNESLLAANLEVAVNGVNFVSRGDATFVYYRRSSVSLADKVSPSFGPMSGGEPPITIRGAGFFEIEGFPSLFSVQFRSSVTGVSKFAGAVRVNSTMLTVIPPSGTSFGDGEAVQLSLALNAQQYIHPAGNYTYFAANVTDIIPRSGPITGDTIIQISGYSFPFSTNIRVEFQELAGGSGDFISEGSGKVTYVSPTTILVKSPPAVLPSGRRIDRVMVVLTIDDRRMVNPDVHFTYYDGSAVRVDRIDPVIGPRSGNSTVFVHGSGFVDTGEVSVAFFDDVSIGGGSRHVFVPAKRLSSTLLECQTPLAAEFVTDLPAFSSKVAVSLNGQQFSPLGLTSTTSYHYSDRQFIVSVTPSNGPRDGDTDIVIRGVNFPAPLTSGSLRVRFVDPDSSSGSSSTGFISQGDVVGTFVDSSTIVCKAPRGRVSMNRPYNVVVRYTVGNVRELNGTNATFTFYDECPQFRGLSPSIALVDSSSREDSPTRIVLQFAGDRFPQSSLTTNATLGVVSSYSVSATFGANSQLGFSHSVVSVGRNSPQSVQAVIDTFPVNPSTPTRSILEFTISPNGGQDIVPPARVGEFDDLEVTAPVRIVLANTRTLLAPQLQSCTMSATLRGILCVFDAPTLMNPVERSLSSFPCTSVLLSRVSSTDNEDNDRDDSGDNDGDGTNDDFDDVFDELFRAGQGGGLEQQCVWLSPSALLINMSASVQPTLRVGSVVALRGGVIAAADAFLVSNGQSIPKASGKTTVSLSSGGGGTTLSPALTVSMGEKTRCTLPVNAATPQSVSAECWRDCYRVCEKADCGMDGSSAAAVCLGTCSMSCSAECGSTVDADALVLDATATTSNALTPVFYRFIPVFAENVSVPVLSAYLRNVSSAMPLSPRIHVPAGLLPANSSWILGFKVRVWDLTGQSLETAVRPLPSSLPSNVSVSTSAPGVVVLRSGDSDASNPVIVYSEVSYFGVGKCGGDLDASYEWTVVDSQSGGTISLSSASRSALYIPLSVLRSNRTYTYSVTVELRDPTNTDESAVETGASSGTFRTIGGNVAIAVEGGRTESYIVGSTQEVLVFNASVSTSTLSSGESVRYTVSCHPVQRCSGECDLSTEITSCSQSIQTESAFADSLRTGISTTVGVRNSTESVFYSLADRLAPSQYCLRIHAEGSVTKRSTDTFRLLNLTDISAVLTAVGTPGISLDALRPQAIVRIHGPGEYVLSPQSAFAPPLSISSTIERRRANISGIAVWTVSVASDGTFRSSAFPGDSALIRLGKLNQRALRISKTAFVSSPALVVRHSRLCDQCVYNFRLQFVQHVRGKDVSMQEFEALVSRWNNVELSRALDGGIYRSQSGDVYVATSSASIRVHSHSAITNASSRISVSPSYGVEMVTPFTVNCSGMYAFPYDRYAVNVQGQSVRPHLQYAVIARSTADPSREISFLPFSPDPIREVLLPAAEISRGTSLSKWSVSCTARLVGLHSIADVSSPTVEVTVELTSEEVDPDDSDFLQTMDVVADSQLRSSLRTVIPDYLLILEEVTYLQSRVDAYSVSLAEVGEQHVNEIYGVVTVLTNQLTSIADVYRRYESVYQRFESINGTDYLSAAIESTANDLFELLESTLKELPRAQEQSSQTLSATQALLQAPSGTTGRCALSLRGLGFLADELFDTLTQRTSSADVTSTSLRGVLASLGQLVRCGNAIPQSSSAAKTALRNIGVDVAGSIEHFGTILAEKTALCSETPVVVNATEYSGFAQSLYTGTPGTSVTFAADANGVSTLPGLVIHTAPSDENAANSVGGLVSTSCATFAAVSSKLNVFRHLGSISSPSVRTFSGSAAATPVLVSHVASVHVASDDGSFATAVVVLPRLRTVADYVDSNSLASVASHIDSLSSETVTGMANDRIVPAGQSEYCILWDGSTSTWTDSLCSVDFGASNASHIACNCTSMGSIAAASESVHLEGESTSVGIIIGIVAGVVAVLAVALVVHRVRKVSHEKDKYKHLDHRIHRQSVSKMAMEEILRNPLSDLEADNSHVVSGLERTNLGLARNDQRLPVENPFGALPTPSHY